MQLRFSKPVFLALLVLLNTIPVYGVFQWGWKSFDLIFLYWLENLIIGGFMILRMLVRPYAHAVELAMPIFLVPFFAFHYGMFCYGHGKFVIHLFGEGLPPGLANMDIPEIILPLVEARHLFWPLLGLFAYHLLDWVRDVSERGLGSDGIRQLTVAPYRRIIILHITIIASGFALGALNEPLLGLLLLVTFKTGMDIYHWHKDEQAVQSGSVSGEPVIDEKIKQKVDAFLDDPKITINGKETRYNSFEALKASPHYALLKGMLSMTAGNQQLRAIEAYVEQRQRERNKPG
jgi:hypothetical protein